MYVQCRLYTAATFKHFFLHLLSCYLTAEILRSVTLNVSVKYYRWWNIKKKKVCDFCGGRKSTNIFFFFYAPKTFHHYEKWGGETKKGFKLWSFFRNSNDKKIVICSQYFTKTKS